jgi:hypothetical protein
MNSTTSSETPDLLSQAKKAGLSRWKLETLSGLLAYRSANHHQKEREKNIEAENKRVRKELWTDECERSGEDMGHTILGDYHPPQVVVAGGQQGSGIGKVLAGAALGASLLGVPGAGIAGYLFSQMQSQKPATVTTSPATNEGETVDLGLKKIEDLEL